MKPLGQKSLVVDGVSVGEDSYLVDKALDLGLSLDVSAPFAASAGAAESFLLTGEPKDIPRRIKRAFSYLARRYGLVVVEGTGHPGVGSVFNLANSSVAALLRIPVLLILEGGIGSTIDRFSICRSMFAREQVDILGVIINKVLPAKAEKVRAVLDPWFNARHIPVFGYIPYHSSISNPSLAVLRRELKAEPIILAGTGYDRLVSGYLAACGSSPEVVESLRTSTGKVLVVSTSRRDVIDALLARKLSGSLPDNPQALIMCGAPGVAVEPWVVEACQKLSLPLFQTKEAAEDVAARLHHQVFKIAPNESLKINEIVELMATHVDMDAIFAHLQGGPGAGRARGRRRPGGGLISWVFSQPLRVWRRLWGRRG